MFKRKVLMGDEPRFFLVQKLAQHIDYGDILTEETLAPGTRKRGVNPTAKDFFNDLDQFKALGFLTHEATKNHVSHTGTKVSDYLVPLVFLSVIYNRRNAFKALIDFFGPDIADLKDGMASGRGNILHHMYGRNSMASSYMINDVFDCLEKSTSKEKILAMIHEKDLKGASGFSVLDYACSYNLGVELRSRIAQYSEGTTSLPSYQAAEPSREASSVQHGFSMFAMPLGSEEEAAVNILMSFRGGLL